MAPSYQSFYPPADVPFVAPTPEENGTASITVRVPANAQVWWNGVASAVGGEIRYFRTAPLPADGAMQTFQARWTGADGRMVAQTREVRVMPSGTVTVDFNQPANEPIPAIK